MTFLAAVRTKLFLTVLLIWIVGMSTLFLWTVLLPQKLFDPLMRSFLKVVDSIERAIVGIRYEVLGRENLPPGPFIIAAKHQSMWETIKLPVLFEGAAVVLKKELVDMPIWGVYARKSGMIPVDRSKGRSALTAMSKSAEKAVAEKRPIVIFPQGTRTAPGATESYKIGVGALYRDLGLPVVPMALNSGLFWPKKGLIRGGKITVQLLPPIAPGLSLGDFMRTLETQLETASNHLAETANRTEK
jgi:1-acyl-sn-glycerol-3-phosphate acyltransferase